MKDLMSDVALSQGQIMSRSSYASFMAQDRGDDFIIPKVTASPFIRKRSQLFDKPVETPIDEMTSDDWNLF